jgi:hypothetical protein
MDSVRSRIYFKVYFMKWKQKHSQHFVDKIKQKSSVLNTGYSTERASDSKSVEAYELDTVELLERARRTIDELTSSSFRSRSITTGSKNFEKESSSFSSINEVPSTSFASKSLIYPDSQSPRPVSYPKDGTIHLKERRKNFCNSLADSFQVDGIYGKDKHTSAFSALNYSINDTDDTQSEVSF